MLNKKGAKKIFFLRNFTVYTTKKPENFSGFLFQNKIYAYFFFPWLATASISFLISSGSPKK